MIYVNCIECPGCGEIIYSRARHDFRACSCEMCFIDGGFDYIRTGGDVGKVFKRGVKATRKQLYDDWNYSEDKYGKIKN